MRSLREFYLSTAVSRVAQAWNAIREATLREAVVGRLLPNLEAELRARLARSAREAALHDVQDKLWAWAKRAPLQVRACCAVHAKHCRNEALQALRVVPSPAQQHDNLL